MKLDVLNFFVLLFCILNCVSASAYLVFSTKYLQQPIILLKFPISNDPNQVARLVGEYKAARDFSEPAILNTLRRFLERFPGSSYVVDIGAIMEASCNNIRGYIISELNELHANNEDIIRDADSRHPRDIQDWRIFYTFPNTTTLPINVRRSFIVEDSVKAYKDLDHIPDLIPNHLFNRNIKVTFVDEAGVDEGGLRNEFFSIFFREVIENSGLFALNSEGYVIVATGRTYLKDFDIYEAFGFYLGKAFQNRIPVGCQFADIIIEMIKYGQVSLTDLDLLQSWDPELASSLRSLENLSSSDLSSFNFNDLGSDFPSIIVDRENLSFYKLFKMRNEIYSKFRIQLVMIALGFARACPGNLLARSNFNLSAAFVGDKTLTAEALISAFTIEGPLSAVTAYSTFSKWLRTLTNTQLMSFFRFLTGMKVIPPGNLSNLFLKIAFSAPGTEYLLPRANTCRRTFILPAYQTEELAMERFNTLLRLLESGEAFCFGLA